MPYVALVVCFTVAIMFLIAGAAKLRDVGAFARAITDYKLVPPRLSSTLAWCVALAELSAGVFLMLGIVPGVVMLAVAGLLIIFGAAAMINLLRGRRISCGCFGTSGRAVISWPLVTRNILLAVIVAASSSRLPRNATMISTGTSGSAVPAAAGATSLLLAIFLLVLLRNAAAWWTLRALLAQLRLHLREVRP